MELESVCASLKKDNEALKLKTDDLENRSRRNNIRITNLPNLPERVKGPRPTAFLVECLKEVFGPEAFPSLFSIDRAHRINVRRRGSDAPRPFIARIYHFQNKELILRLAHEKGRLVYRGTEIHVFPNYSPEVSQKRAAFSEVKSQLRAAGFPYRMFFPAKLQVTDKHGQKLSFTTVEEVELFLGGAARGAAILVHKDVPFQLDQTISDSACNSLWSYVLYPCYFNFNICSKLG